MSDRQEFRPGQVVECRDATDGCHFLEVGRFYRVEQVREGPDGRQRVCLHGMARMWEGERFRLVGRG